MVQTVVLIWSKPVSDVTEAACILRFIYIGSGGNREDVSISRARVIAEGLELIDMMRLVHSVIFCFPITKSTPN